MDLLFKREQTTGKLARVNFKLWGKIELDSDEQAIVKRYRFDEAILIEALQPRLIRNVIIIAVIVLIFTLAFFTALFGGTIAVVQRDDVNFTWGVTDVLIFDDPLS